LRRGCFLLVPEARLVGWPTRVVPSFEKQALHFGVFCPPVQFFDPHFHPVLAEANIFLFHFLGGFARYILCYTVGNIANEAEEPEDYNEDDEG